MTIKLKGQEVSRSGLQIKTANKKGTSYEEGREMNKQAVLDVLNNLKVFEQQDGENSYILVLDNEATRAQLRAVGVTDKEIDDAGDGVTFCTLTLSLNGRYADEYKNGHLIVWGPINEEVRNRVMVGEGTPEDAERLLRTLEPYLFE